MKKKILWITLAMLMVTGALSFTGCTTSEVLSGARAISNTVCSKCGNTGYYNCKSCAGFGRKSQNGEMITCGSCNGAGKFRCSH